MYVGPNKVVQVFFSPKNNKICCTIIWQNRVTESSCSFTFSQNSHILEECNVYPLLYISTFPIGKADEHRILLECKQNSDQIKKSAKNHNIGKSAQIS